MTQPLHLFDGTSPPHAASFPEAPPWRRFTRQPGAPDHAAAPPADAPYWSRARSYCVAPDIVDAVNAALVLRRPLLVTGKPGTGKSTLVYRVAYELMLGPVLVWPVNSRSTIKEGLYDYDAIGRMQDRQLAGGAGADDIGRYVTLRALGTALLPATRPRALLIDELDKADPDLPNDLLHVFEEGWFDIPELQRHHGETVDVRVSAPVDVPGARTEATVARGRVACDAFPFIVVTSNGEREFPPAFLRRCIRVVLPDPTPDQLTKIVRAHLGDAIAAEALGRINAFASTQNGSSTDQLLNALYIVNGLNGTDHAERERVMKLLTQSLA